MFKKLLFFIITYNILAFGGERGRYARELEKYTNLTPSRQIELTNYLYEKSNKRLTGINFNHIYTKSLGITGDPGFHAARTENAQELLTNKKFDPKGSGTYTASIALFDHKTSTFFPDNWTYEQDIDCIVNAFLSGERVKNQERGGQKVYEGICINNKVPFKVRIIADKEGKVVTSFPIIKEVKNHRRKY